jgi:hypothetical protein
VVAEGKAFNVLPSGNRAPDSTDQNSGYDQTRADFDFDRGSNAAATRIGSDGLIEKYRENELLQSNQFDTTWNSQGVLTSGQADKDGGTSAWSFTSASGTSGLYQNITTGGVQTFSAYVKKNATHGLRIYMFGGLNAATYFNLNTGSVVSSLGGTLNASIEAYNSEWWRISVTCNTTLSQIYFYCTNNNQTQVVGTITIQNAQLESGLVSTDYLESTSVTGKAGVLVDLPRINYDANGENGSLLLEPSRQQLLQYSEYFAGWDNSTYPITIASNQIASPSGNINASLLTPNSGSSRHAIKETISCSATTYTLSAFYKKANAQYVVLSDGGDTSWHIVTADLENGTITDETNATGTIESYKNDWYRVTCTFTRTNASTIQAFLGASPTDSNSGLPSFNDTSLTTYAYGAQCELGSYPSSYIPNHGESGGVTRAADSCSVTGASDVMPTSYPFTLYAEMDVKAIGDEWGISFLNDAANNNYFVIGVNFQNKYGMISRPSGSSSFIYSNVNATEGTHKICGVFTSSELKLYVDGTLLDTETNAQSFNSSIDDILIGTLRSVGDTGIRNNVRQAMIFDSALTQSEAEALTTL